MNLISDGNFTLKKGQGISQGIADELGLSEEQLSKLDKKTWESVFNEIKKQKEISPELYQGGSDLNGSTDNNFVVHSGQDISISLKTTWNKILEIINNTLGTNFEGSAEDIEKTNTKISEQQEEPKTTNINDPDGKLTEKLQTLKAEIVRRQKEIMQQAGGNGVSWPQNLIDEYNSIGPQMMKEIEKYIGKPEQEGQYLQILDADNNPTLTFKAVTSSSSEELGWLY